MSNAARLKIFVHVAENKCAEMWLQHYISGKLVGRNDPTPYGYGRAQDMGCDVVFSRKNNESLFSKFVRLSLRVILGFDLVHAYRQRRYIFASDVVWTHTESQFLAIAALFIFRKVRPKLIGQAIWMLDEWSSYSLLRKIVFRRLLRKVDVLFTLSQSNAAVARRLFPGLTIKFVKFGVPSEQYIKPQLKTSAPFSIVAVGNDRHRDWDTLVKAVSGIALVQLRIVSSTASSSLGKHYKNIRVQPATSNVELCELYDRANIAIVPLKENLHASGITAIEEAVLAGLPVIASDTGGLVDYFERDHVLFVQPTDVEKLREAIIYARDNYASLVQNAAAAQSHLVNSRATANFYIGEYVAVSRALSDSPSSI